MGLQEKRALEEFKTGAFGDLVGQVHNAAKFDVEIEMDWDSLLATMKAHLFAECVPKVYFTPLIDSLKSICADEMGATALKDTLKKIIIRDTDTCSIGTKWATFKDGILILDHKCCTNVDRIQERSTNLTKLLENNL